jgi:putative DNA primase/helicase
MTTSAIDYAGLDDAAVSNRFAHAAGCPEAGKPHETVFVPLHCEDPNSHLEHDRDHGGFGTFACLACRRAEVPLTDAEWDSVGASKPPAVDWTQADATTDLDRARLNLLHLRGKGLDLAYSRKAAGDGWLIWDGTIWKTAYTEDVVPFIHETSDRLKEAADALWTQARDASDDDNADTYRKRASRLLTSARAMRRARAIADIVTTLKSLPGVSVDFAAFDANPDLLQVANGVINLRTGQLRAPDKHDRITRRVDVAYAPEAQAPTWDRFLSEILVDEDGSTDQDVIDFMRRLTGYGITGHTREQCFAVLFGKGGNGKGVFTETLKAIFAAYTTATPFSTFEERQSGAIPNDLAALKGARLVLASEGEAGKPMAEAVIKRVTGQDTIPARFMRAEWFEFKPSFLIMLSTNYRPNFRGQDEGLWRRVKLVPFRRDLPEEERDGTLGDRLLTEAEGILAWAVRGAVEWYAGGLREPASLKRGTAAYREESDRLGEFLAERIEITGEHLDVITLTDAWNAYRDWAYKAGEEQHFARRLFSVALGERAGITPDRRSNRPIYRNVRLRTEAEVQQIAQQERRAAAGGMELAAAASG